MKIPVFLSIIMTAVIILTAACTAETQPANIGTATANITEEKALYRDPDITDIVGARESAPGTEVQLSCMGKDYNGGTLTYTWSVDQGKIKDADKTTGAQAIWITPDTEGTFNVTVKAVSSKGGEATYSKSFKVVTYPFGNKPVDNTVYLNFSSSSSSLVRETQATVVLEFSEIQCEVEGQESDALTFTWNAPIGKISGNGLEEGQASRVGWIAPGVPGKYTVGVTVTDASGHEMSGEVEFDVAAMR